MPTQLRIYTINRDSLQQFAAEWRDKILPLRRKLGFQIEGAWLMPDTGQFIWLISHEGPETWETKDAEYFSSAERQAMQPDPARLIARLEQHFVERIL